MRENSSNSLLKFNYYSRRLRKLWLLVESYNAATLRERASEDTGSLSTHSAQLRKRHEAKW